MGWPGDELIAGVGTRGLVPRGAPGQQPRPNPHGADRRRNTDRRQAKQTGS